MPENSWWKRGTVYQIYPRSFQDSNGDGIGDLNGIRRRLDHLSRLGVDAIWVSPIYPSPMADFGYDVADYCDIDPIFGRLDDFDNLVEELHARGLKLILDFVPNHTSDQHPWFIESRASLANAKRDWYIWREPGPGGGPPNNWISNFGGSAWERDETTGQYYYHAFLKDQPDLNWRNGEVRAAMYDALRFWLRRGVDGFRVDVIWHLIKDAEFRDNPRNPGYLPDQAEINRFLQVYSADQPEVHEVVTEMRRVLEEFDDRVLIGEIYLPLERLVTYYGNDLSGAHLPFNFQLIHSVWSALEIARLIREYEVALPVGGWPNWVLGNHDQRRIAARVGEPQARVAAMLLLTLRGTPTLYYGDEVGIGRVEVPSEEAQDPWERNEPGLGLGRDPQRTPMPWDGSQNAGFTSGKPWLPLNADAAIRNIEAQLQDTSSILTLYHRLIALRRERLSLSVGSFDLIEMGSDVLAYVRRRGAEKLLIALNLCHQAQELRLPEWTASGSILLSTFLDRNGEKVATSLELRPDEGVVIQLDHGPTDLRP